MFLPLTFVCLLVSTAQALHLTTPPNGYLGDLRSTITCNTLGFNVTLDGEFAATGPLVLEAGQQFYANDVAGNLTLPESIGSLAALFGVSYADIRLFIELALVDLYPNDFNPAPEGIWINGTKLSSTSDTTVRFPQQGVLGGFGPITAGSANTTGLVYLGNTTADLYLYGSTGNLILGPVDVTCPVPSYNALLATFNTYASTSDSPPVISPANNFLVDFPPLEENTQFGCFDFQYDCTVGTYGVYPFDVSTCGGAGGLYVAGQEFSVFNSTTSVTIPADLVSGLKDLFPGTTTIDYTANSLYIMVDNAQPAALSGVPAEGHKETLLVPTSGDLVFSLPSMGNGFNFGPFTVDNNPGGTTNIFIGNSTSHLVYRNASGNALGSTAVVCHTHHPRVTVIGVTIVPVGAENVIGLTGI